MGKWRIDQVTTGLYELAEYIATHADLPYNLGDYSPAMEFDTYLFGSDDEAKLQDVARKMGKCDKEPEDDMYYVSRSFGDGAVRIRFGQSRETVCTKVQIGTRTEKVLVNPQYEQREVPEYEYSCPESLLRDT